MKIVATVKQNYWPVFLCGGVYYAARVGSSFESLESFWAVISCGTVYYAVQGGSNFWVCEWNPKVPLFKRKLMSTTFL